VLATGLRFLILRPFLWPLRADVFHLLVANLTRSAQCGFHAALRSWKSLHVVHQNADDVCLLRKARTDDETAHLAEVAQEDTPIDGDKPYTGDRRVYDVLSKDIKDAT
jgi:hypothetical protein